MTHDLTGPTKDIVLGDGWSIEDNLAANPGRRTLVSAAIWTVPAVGVAIATPAAAASGSGAAANPQPARADLRTTYVAWNAQGGQQAVPADGTFHADNGLFVHAKAVNDGPDTITGVRVYLSLPHYSIQMNGARPHFPVAGSGWDYVMNYMDAGDNRRWVFAFQNASLTLAPGQTAEVVINFWTIPDAGRTEDGIKPFVVFGLTNAEETNPGNNGKLTDNSFNVHT